MAEPYEMWADEYQGLGYDLQAAIDKYKADMLAHAKTIGIAAPTTHGLVEAIVKYHDGLFVLVADPPPLEKQPLPTDPKYYKTKADQVAIAAKEAKDAATLKAQAEKEARQAKQAEKEARQAK